MASRINQNWVFGKAAGLDFSTALPPPSPALPTPYTGTAIGLGGWREGCGSISDANGQLALYTDGQTVWDGGGTPLASGLQGDRSCTESGIIVPDPGNPAGYYVFTTGERMTGNHVDGRRISTQPPVTVTPLSSMLTLPTAGWPTEKLTAIQHANCRDFWVITLVQTEVDPKNLTPEQVSAKSWNGWLRVFLVTPSGVQHVTPDVALNEKVQRIGYLKGSSDGKRIAFANFFDSTVMVYPFDNATGTIDPSQRITLTVPPIPIPNPPGGTHQRLPYGIEFSPNGKLLYFTVVGNPPGQTTLATRGYVFQYDLLAGTLFPTSPTTWFHDNAGGEYSLGALQRGVDGRIYIAQDGEDKLGMIEYPDLPGAGCNLVFDALTLAPGSNCWMGLPNLIPNPCGCTCEEEGNCDAAVDEANHILDERADGKFFTIPARGQKKPARCHPALAQGKVAPEFYLRWGDGPSDQFEDHDTEIIYIRIRNPFRDLIFRGVKIFHIRVTPNQVLPDGDNALQLIPAEIACFDEIEPCGQVSRDFAFLIQNAVPQGYQVTFDYCIEEIVVVSDGKGSVAFDIDVVAS